MSEFLPSHSLDVSGFAKLGVAAALAATVINGIQVVNDGPQESLTADIPAGCASDQQFDSQFDGSVHYLAPFISNPTLPPVTTERNQISEIASIVRGPQGPVFNIDNLPTGY